MQVELKDITIGNFIYDGAYDLDEVQTQEVLRQGVLRLLQGKPSGDWEKGILKRMFPAAKKREDIEVDDVDKDGTPIKRAFRRTDIPFSAEDAKALAEAYEAVEFTIGENEKGEALKSTLSGVISNVREYEGGQKAEPKYKRVKDFIHGYLAANGGKLSSGLPRTAASFAENRGLAAPTEPWQEDTVFLAAANEWLIEDQKKREANE